MTVRATFELDPPEWAERLAVLESVGLANADVDVRAHGVEVRGRTATL